MRKAYTVVFIRSTVCIPLHKQKKKSTQYWNSIFFHCCWPLSEHFFFLAVMQYRIREDVVSNIYIYIHIYIYRSYSVYLCRNNYLHMLVQWCICKHIVYLYTLDVIDTCMSKGEVSETVMINGGVIVTCMRGNDVINTCIDTDDVS